MGGPGGATPPQVKRGVWGGGQPPQVMYRKLIKQVPKTDATTIKNGVGKWGLFFEGLWHQFHMKNEVGRLRTGEGGVYRTVRGVRFRSLEGEG